MEEGGGGPSGIASPAHPVPLRRELRPQAIRVLKEIDIDISAHRSKGVGTIDPFTVDAVITLCAEEVCPVFLGEAVRHHWGLPDPAVETGDEDRKLAAFRSVRDELRRRLEFLFKDWGE